VEVQQLFDYTMDKLRITQLKSVFDTVVHYINSDDDSQQVEVWFDRELQELLLRTLGKLFGCHPSRCRFM